MISARPPTKVVLGAIGQLVITLIIMGVLLFWPAGTLAWARGWWFLGIFVLLVLVAMAWLWRVNPEIFAARSRPTGAGTKTWDKVIVPLILVGFLAVCVVGGLDDGRFHWAPVPSWVVICGYVVFVVGFGLSVWAPAVNRHFEPSVRIQTDRDHQVIDTGPYAYVRHPGYSAAAVLVIGMALALGSFWALVPAFIVIAVTLVRTLLEEQTLRAGLPGYSAYSARVRYRWIPGVW